MCFISKARLKRMIKENTEKFAHEETKLLETVSAEIKRIIQLESLTPDDSLTKEDIRRQWDEYWEHYDTLDQPLRKRVAYVLARRRWSTGKSGMHSSYFQSDLPFPIRMCGWFYYYNSSHHYKDGGVMFKIDPECFGRWDAQLFYFDDDNWPCYKSYGDCDGSPRNEGSKELELIKRFSSGISDVHIEYHTCVDQFGKTAKHRCIVFRIDTSAIKKKCAYEPDPTINEPLGDFIFCLPRAGEFWCTLGQIHQGELIPLHNDNFCMK